MPPPKGWHGFVEAAITAALDRYLEERGIQVGWEPQQGSAGLRGPGRSC
jgi:hypothetical protein